MAADLLVKEWTLGRNVNFGCGEGYLFMQPIGDQRIQCVSFDALPYGMRGILLLEKFGFAN